MNVDTSTYVFNHGHAPRGQGIWIFEIGSEEFWAGGSYTQAKRRATRHAKALGVTSIRVLP